MRRKIITFCGSTRFKKEFRDIERALTIKGDIVLPPAIFGKIEKIIYPKKLEKKLLNLHLDKIRLSDEILVIDVDGYLGDSTKKEIEFAKKLGKKVTYYSKVFPKIKKNLNQLKEKKK